MSWRCHTGYFRQVFLGTLCWIGEGSMQTGEMLPAVVAMPTHEQLILTLM